MSQFAKGSYVVYGKMGVCEVLDRQVMAIGGEKGEYYVLGPVSDPRSSVYVPCDNVQLMGRLRPLLTHQEIEAMLDDVDNRQIDWVDDRNQRSAAFRAVVSSGDRQELLRLIRCLYRKKQEKVADGKRLSSMDETLLQECIRLVEEEFALALDIPQYEVGAFIRQRLDG
ncbi:MAG: hypothetical protein IJ518_00845 [Clostridia bacterium]|nr:hypothetical protein [Clostridia bacterium]